MASKNTEYNFNKTLYCVFLAQKCYMQSFILTVVEVKQYYHCLFQNPLLICDSQRSVTILTPCSQAPKLNVAKGSGKHREIANTPPYKDIFRIEWKKRYQLENSKANIRERLQQRCLLVSVNLHTQRSFGVRRTRYDGTFEWIRMWYNHRLDSRVRVRR